MAEKKIALFNLGSCKPEDCDKKGGCFLLREVGCFAMISSEQARLLKIDEKVCSGCKDCDHICPQGVISYKIAAS